MSTIIDLDAPPGISIIARVTINERVSQLKSIVFATIATITATAINGDIRSVECVSNQLCSLDSSLQSEVSSIISAELAVCIGTLIQVLYTIFDKILLPRYCDAQIPQLRFLWLSSLRLVRSIIAINSQHFILLYQFFHDSARLETALAAECARLSSDVNALSVPFTANSVAFRSPIFAACFIPFIDCTDIRVEAIKCLTAAMKGLSLQYWCLPKFSMAKSTGGKLTSAEKVSTTVLKTLRSILLCFCGQVNVDLLKHLLQLFQIMIGDLPLQAALSMHLHSDRNDSPLEGLCTAVFHTIFKFTCGTAMRVDPAGREAGAIKAIVIDWLCDISKSFQPLQCLQRALSAVTRGPTQLFRANASSNSSSSSSANSGHHQHQLQQQQQQQQCRVWRTSDTGNPNPSSNSNSVANSSSPAVAVSSSLSSSSSVSPSPSPSAWKEVSTWKRANKAASPQQRPQPQPQPIQHWTRNSNLGGKQNASMHNNNSGKHSIINPAQVSSAVAVTVSAAAVSPTPPITSMAVVTIVELPFIELIGLWSSDSEMSSSASSSLSSSSSYTPKADREIVRILSACRQYYLSSVLLFPIVCCSHSNAIHTAIVRSISHKENDVREFGFKLLTEVWKLRKSDWGVEYFSTHSDVVFIEGKEIGKYLLPCLSDADQRVRLQAVVAVGEICHDDWIVLSQMDCGISLSTAVANDSQYQPSVALYIIYIVMQRTCEEFGTIRTAACRVLGQMLNNGVMSAICIAQQRLQPMTPFRVTVLPIGLATAANAVTTTTTTTSTSATNCTQSNSGSSGKDIPVLLSPTDIRSVASSAASLTRSNVSAATPAVRTTTTTSKDLPLQQSQQLSAYDVLDRSFLVSITSCIRDSKLSVRLQGAYALGCCLLRLLPFRLQYLRIRYDEQPHQQQQLESPPNSSNSDSGSNCVHIGLVDDETWLTCVQLSIALLVDSDKVLASAARCLGLLSAGLLPGISAHGILLSDILIRLLQKFLYGKKLRINKRTSEEDSRAATESLVELMLTLIGADGAVFSGQNDIELETIMEANIVTLPKKVVFSLNLAFGLISRVYFTHCIAVHAIPPSLGNSFTSSTSNPLTRIEDVKVVFAAMLRLGITAKIKLQACKGLIFLFFAECTTISPLLAIASVGSSFSASFHKIAQQNFIKVLESIFLLITNFVRVRSIHSIGTISSTSNTNNSSSNSSSYNSSSCSNSSAVKRVVASPSSKSRSSNASHDSNNCNGSANAVAVAVTPTSVSSSSNNNSIIDCRSNSLQRAVLVLMWILLRQLSEISTNIRTNQYSPNSNSATANGVNEMFQLFVMTIVHHVEPLVDWLLIISKDHKAISVSELSLSSFPNVDTSPEGLFGMESQLSCTDLSVNIGRLLLDILAPSYASDQAAGSEVSAFSSLNSFANCYEDSMASPSLLSSDTKNQLHSLLNNNSSNSSKHSNAVSTATITASAAHYDSITAADSSSTAAEQEIDDRVLFAPNNAIGRNIRPNQLQRVASDDDDFEEDEI